MSATVQRIRDASVQALADAGVELPALVYAYIEKELAGMNVMTAYRMILSAGDETRREYEKRAMRNHKVRYVLGEYDGRERNRVIEAKTHEIDDDKLRYAKKKFGFKFQVEDAVKAIETVPIEA